MVKIKKFEKRMIKTGSKIVFNKLDSAILLSQEGNLNVYIPKYYEQHQKPLDGNSMYIFAISVLMPNVAFQEIVADMYTKLMMELEQKGRKNGNKGSTDINEK